MIEKLPTAASFSENVSAVQLETASPVMAESLTNIALAAKAYWGYSADFLEKCRSVLTVSPEKIAHEDTVTIVAKKDNELVGFALALPVSDTTDQRTAELEFLFVHPDAIGIGIGTKLFTAVTQRLKTAGFTCMFIESDPHAVEFYQKQGAVLNGYVSSSVDTSRSLPILVYTI